MSTYRCVECLCNIIVFRLLKVKLHPCLFWFDDLFSDVDGSLSSPSHHHFLCMRLESSESDVLPVLLCILANLCIPISLHNEYILFGNLVNGYLQVAVEIFCLVIAIVSRWGVNVLL